MRITSKLFISSSFLLQVNLPGLPRKNKGQQLQWRKLVPEVTFLCATSVRKQFPLTKGNTEQGNWLQKEVIR